VLESFSAAGGTNILFAPDGRRLSTPEKRLKPDIVAPDNVSTTSFEDGDNDGYPNFLGTSAAAPHVAGAVALMLESNPLLLPTDIAAILRRSAVDMGGRATSISTADAGFDHDSGYGLINVGPRWTRPGEPDRVRGRARDLTRSTRLHNRHHRLKEHERRAHEHPRLLGHLPGRRERVVLALQAGELVA